MQSCGSEPALFLLHFVPKSAGRTEGYFGFPLFWSSCKRSFSAISPWWKGPSCLTRYVTGYTSCSSLCSSWGGVSSSTGAWLSQRKPSSAVVVAAHVLGRSHCGHAELAYSFSMVLLRHLIWLPLNLVELDTQTCLWHWCCKGWGVICGREVHYL